MEQQAFVAIPNPSREQFTDILSDSAALNPFYTFNYLVSQSLLGHQPWIFAVRHGDHITTPSCTGFLNSGHFTKNLTIASLPIISGDKDVFWKGIVRFCEQHQISYLDLNTYASVSANIPHMPGEIVRRKRWEYLVELQDSDLWSNLSSNHLRNIKKAAKSGIQIRRTKDVSAAKEHAELVFSSRERREERGEATPDDNPLQEYVAILQSGAGELFMAIINDRPVSSLLVLTTKRSAYYHSAGTSKEGMALGASHFLIQQAANQLRSESIEHLNLGGTDQKNPGLLRFKSGFGTSVVQLEAAECYFGSNIRRILISGIQVLRSEPLQHFRKLLTFR